MNIPAWVAVVTVIVFGIYFLVVRSELKKNNELIHGYRSDITSREGKIEEEVVSLFKRTTTNWTVNASGDYEEAMVSSRLETSITRILDECAKSHVNGEEFIDSVVKRINRKQVG
jgi:hypothetical protein